MVISNIPVGLYIARYYLVIQNPSLTVTSTISNYQTSISDAGSIVRYYWNDSFPYTLKHSTTANTSSQCFSQTTIINNAVLQNYTLRIGIYYSGNALYWGSPSAEYQSYFQFVKIG